MEQQQVLIIAAVSFVIIAVVLVVVIMRQKRQIQQMQQPKYGFLGKPIVPALATIALAVATVGGIMVMNNRDAGIDSFVASAGKVDVQIEKTCLRAQNGEYSYEFTAVPQVDGEAYGDGLVFNTYWTFDANSQNTVSLSEHALSKTNPGGVDIDLKTGVHNVTVLVLLTQGSIEGETSFPATEAFNVNATECNQAR